MTYYVMNDGQLEQVNKASNITGGDYEIKGNCITAENLIAAIEDLMVEVGRLEEKYSDLEKELEENYKPISYAEQIGYNERDFY